LQLVVPTANKTYNNSDQILFHLMNVASETPPL